MSKPDGFILAANGEKEYVIDAMRRVATHANCDDTVMHWILNLCDSDEGNIAR